MYDPVYLCKKAFFIPSYTVYHSDSSLTDSVILFNTAGLDLTPGVTAVLALLNLATQSTILPLFQGPEGSTAGALVLPIWPALYKDKREGGKLIYLNLGPFLIFSSYPSPPPLPATAAGIWYKVQICFSISICMPMRPGGNMTIGPLGSL